MYLTIQFSILVTFCFLFKTVQFNKYGLRFKTEVRHSASQPVTFSSLLKSSLKLQNSFSPVEIYYFLKHFCENNSFDRRHACFPPKSCSSCRETEYNTVCLDQPLEPQNCVVSIIRFCFFFCPDHQSMISVVNPCSLLVIKRKCPQKSMQSKSNLFRKFTKT